MNSQDHAEDQDVDLLKPKEDIRKTKPSKPVLPTRTTLKMGMIVGLALCAIFWIGLALFVRSRL